MSADDWYRNTRWNGKIEKAFFDRLARSRTQRDQHLAIQALTLAPHKPNAALSLVDHYFETRRSDFDDVRAYLARAEAYRALKKVPEAVQAYKDVLDWEAGVSRFATHTLVELPYYIACQEQIEEYAFALSLLEKGIGENPWPLSHFMWQASMALIASHQGHAANARDYAHKALAIAEVRKSGFRYHQNIGLVGEEHQAMIKKLVKLVGLKTSYLENLTGLIQGTWGKT